MSSFITLKNAQLVVPVFEARQKAMQANVAQYMKENYFGRLERNKITLLHDISLDLKNGDRLGIMGENGAGKSTLLRVMAGAYKPTSGTYAQAGKISSFFNIGLGFEQYASGYNNIILRSLSMGMSYKQSKSVVDDVLDFAQLGESIKRPLYTYSNGMRLRLAFAILTAHKHDIMLMDEWIGAGDRRFIDAAKVRLQSRVDEANIMVVATHNRNLMREVCNKGMVLDQGRILYRGEIEDAVAYYETEIVEKRKLME